MKRFYLLLTGLIFFSGWAGAQNEKISFNKTEHDFGVIGEQDGNASIDFVLTNRSKEPIVISKVTASCGCTTPIWTREPIEQGKTGTISVSYNPLRRIGSFTKTITVFVANQPSPFYLRISGEVVEGKMKGVPGETYPESIGNYRFKSTDLDFGQVGWKQTKTIRWEVFNDSDSPITQKTLKLPKYITIVFNPQVIPAKTAATVDVNLNAQDEDTYGYFSGDITLSINDAPQNFHYSVTVLDDFTQLSPTQKSDAGRINVNMDEINFGDFTAGVNKTLKISNSGKSVLNVRAIQSTDPAITVSRTRLSINPQEIAEIRIIADNKKIRSKLSSKLTIISDDPNTPIYTLSVFGLKKL